MLSSTYYFKLTFLKYLKVRTCDKDVAAQKVLAIYVWWRWKIPHWIQTESLSADHENLPCCYFKAKAFPFIGFCQTHLILHVLHVWLTTTQAKANIMGLLYVAKISPFDLYLYCQDLFLVYVFNCLSLIYCIFRICLFTT